MSDTAGQPWPTCEADAGATTTCGKERVAIVQTHHGWLDLCQFHALAAIIDRATWDKS